MKTASPALGDAEFRRMAVAIGYMAEHAHELPSLQQVARSAGLSPYHFARVFRRWAGISPKQYMQHLLLDRAKASLSGHASVLEAAMDAGLSGPGRLHDLFVVIEAVTPGEFKARGEGLEFRHGSAPTPFGTARIVTTARGIAFLGFEVSSGHVPGWQEFRHDWRRAHWIEDADAARGVARTLWALAPVGQRRLRLWVHGTNFQVQVWQALVRHASGATTSYSDLARRIGRPSASRAVGAAVGANPVAWLIPCHHVLQATGALGGYRWGIERKRAMLAWECSQALAAGA